jgi:hypothetical protein
MQLSDERIAHALTRCGLAQQDLVVKSFDTFRKEYPNFSQDVIAQKFSSHQELVMRNIDRVQTELQRVEREQLTPRRAEKNASEYVRVVPRKEARHRESERIKQAESRRTELHRQQVALLEQQQADIAKRDSDRDMERLIIAAVNSERSHARYVRDCQIAELRKNLAASQQPSLPLIPSAPSTPKRSKGPSSIDKRIVDASARRQRHAESVEARAVARRNEEHQRELAFRIGVELESNERRHKADAREEHAAEVKTRVMVNNERLVRDKENRLRAAEELQTESMMRSLSERASNSARFADARDKCLTTASEYRSAQAYALWQRHIEKSAAEDERKRELQRSESEARAVRAEDRERRFAMKEVSVSRMKREHIAKCDELAKKVEQRQEAATVRRDVLLNAVYQ